MEAYCLNNFDKISAEQASELIILCSHCIENPELIEVCERIIGTNIDFLHEECGASFVLEILLGFGQSEFSRQKILSLLKSRIISDIDELSDDEVKEFKDFLADSDMRNQKATTTAEAPGLWSFEDESSKI